MSNSWSSPESWLLHTAVGGALLLALTWWLVRRTHEPARQQRLAEAGLLAALLVAVLSLAPAWLIVPLPGEWTAARETSASGEQVTRGPEQTEVTPPPPADENWALLSPPLAEPEVEPPTADTSASAPVEGPAAAHQPATVELSSVLAWLSRGLVIVYAVVAVVLLLRWLFAWLALARLVATAEPAPAPAARLFETMAGAGPRLLVSRNLRVPVSCGLLRPTVLIPAGLCDARELRWVFAHELTHLRRGDPWTCVLFALGEVVFFYLPWFWLLRWQVRLSQEYLADATVAVGEEHPEDYAEFLLTLTPAPVPAGAASMSSSSSDLYRRITKMLTERNSANQSGRWGWAGAAVCALLALAVLVSGIGLSGAAPALVKEEPKKDAPKEEPKKAEPKKETPKKDQPELFPDLDDLLKRIGPGLDEEGMKDLRRELEEMKKRFEQIRKLPGVGRLPGGLPLPGGFPVVPFGDPNRGEQQARLGVQVVKPSETLVEQLDLPKDKGLVVQKVMPDSPAAKAGLKDHDILLEVAGKAVPSDPAGLVKLLDGIKANEAFNAVVLRKGKKETLKGVTLPEAKAAKKPAGKAFGGAFANPFGGKNVSTVVIRDGDQFTVKHQENGVSMTLTGSVEDGKGKFGSVEIKAGEESKKYDNLDKVPEEHRAKVQKLLDQAAKGKVEIRN